jgi:hypothetical protein
VVLAAIVFVTVDTYINKDAAFENQYASASGSASVAFGWYVALFAGIAVTVFGWIVDWKGRSLASNS